MSPKSAKKLQARKELVSVCLRKCALEVDPLTGTLAALARKIDYHPLTLSEWIARGRVPPKAARVLAKAFPEIANYEALTQG